MIFSFFKGRGEGTMKDWIGKKAKIIVNVDGTRYTYTAKIIDVTDSHITFIDKFGTKYSKILTEVLDIEEAKESE